MTHNQSVNVTQQSVSVSNAQQPSQRFSTNKQQTQRDKMKTLKKFQNTFSQSFQGSRFIDESVD